MTRAPALLGFVVLLVAAAPGRPTLAAAPATTGSCKLLSADAVTRTLHVQIVRVEPSAQDANVCEYSIKGKPSSAATDHSIAMAGAMQGQALDPAAQKLMQGFGGLVLGGADEDAAKKHDIRHPGETPALVLDVHTGDAATEMRLNRQALGSFSPVTPIQGLGDEAFETSNSFLLIRKGTRVIRLTYTGCPCASQDVVTLARQFIGSW
jgi:hypothetical protein